MESPTFLKLNRAVRRKTQLGLGLAEDQLSYTPDYMGVRPHFTLNLELESTKVTVIELPAIHVAREYTAVLVVNPKLYELGAVNAPVFIPHTGYGSNPVISFKPHKKGEITLDWVVEYRLMA